MILCEFRCKKCRKTIVLPRHTLSREFEHRDNPPTDIPPVALVCSHCTTVESYSEADLLGSKEGDTGLRWVAVGELPCVEENCLFHPTVFADWSEATTAEAQKAHIHTWRWHSFPAVCEAGHEIPKPKELYGYHL
jgi:hypothetical protein